MGSGTDILTSINHAHLTVVFATSNHIPTLLKLAPKTPLKLIVSIDDLTTEAKHIINAWADLANVQVLELKDSKSARRQRIARFTEFLFS